MEDSVDQEEGYFFFEGSTVDSSLLLGLFYRDNHIAQNPGVDIPAFSFVEDKGDHIGGAISLEIFFVNLSNAAVIEEEDAEFMAGDTQIVENIFSYLLYSSFTYRYELLLIFK